MRVPCGRLAALAGIALSFVSVVEAQDFAVPSNWRVSLPGRAQYRHIITDLKTQLSRGM